MDNLTNTTKAIVGGVYTITHHRTKRRWIGITAHYANTIRRDIAMLQLGLYPDPDIQALWEEGNTNDFAWRLDCPRPVVELEKGKYGMRASVYRGLENKDLEADSKGLETTRLQHSIDALNAAREARGADYGYVSWDDDHKAYCDLSCDPNEAKGLNFLYSKTPGVYGIYHQKLGLNYIGQSDDVADRHRIHLSDLYLSRHHNKHLQAAYLGDGNARNFSWTLIEIVEDKTQLEHREHFHCLRMKARVKGKNANIETTDPDLKRAA